MGGHAFGSAHLAVCLHAHQVGVFQLVLVAHPLIQMYSIPFWGSDLLNKAHALPVASHPTQVYVAHV
jgi:hypothetical protein